MYIVFKKVKIIYTFLNIEREDTMEDKIVGCLFLIIAAILISTQYIVTAISVSNLTYVGQETFYNSFFDSGYVLFLFSIVFFILGILLLVRGFTLHKINEK